MKIAIVTSGFSASQPGGVSRVALSVSRLIERMNPETVNLISFSNSSKDKNSVRIFDPRTYLNKRISEKYDSGIFFTCIGTFGSDFEFLRYRKRRELKNVFQDYDLIFVVTGTLNFANVLPKTEAVVVIQCATRLNWERKSQYKKMRFLRKTVLKLQVPLLRFQEFSVVNSRHYFLPENRRFYSWLKSRTLLEPFLWYPGTSARDLDINKRNRRFLDGPIVSIGRLNEPRKGWSRLFKSYELARKLDPSLPDLHVIGWGEFGSQDKQRLLGVNKSESIVVHRNLTDLEKELYLRESSIYVQASYEEGLGLAMIEAMCFGLPVVTSETDGSVECVRDKENGYLVKEGPDFEERFARAIIKLRNENLYERGLSSRSIFLKHFSDSASLLKLDQFLTGILGNNPK